MKFGKCVKKFLMKLLLDVSIRIGDYAYSHLDLLDLLDCECKEGSNDE